jgi:hypothetical protein
MGNITDPDTTGTNATTALFGCVTGTDFAATTRPAGITSGCYTKEIVEGTALARGVPSFFLPLAQLGESNAAYTSGNQ